ncbi:hypothetical protein [Hymenobacter cavernae]|uniref:DUF3823 domain-containing protein n=1 Tax=Hymenobacter cavernae TaxID=2044852 RepID=A0ABQ1U0S8_9BACT|nr:hypothetical protein [Hymenobacter cavernae]GGF08344.1 hypothetical protein GCM10011383_19380 [Hymenobacter cavernae]
MPQRFTFFHGLQRGLLGVSLLALAATTGCKTELEPGLETGAAYYPVEVGTYRIYNVIDSTWNSNVIGVTRYQFRERITESFTDAAGKLAYRVVRSRRTLTTDAWKDDSVMQVNPSMQTVLLTRNNRRTVELVFPVQEGTSWNRDAYNTLDTVTFHNRSYVRAGQPFDATTNGQTVHYEQTVTTEDSGVNSEGQTIDDGILQVAKFRQVYARNVGLVYRVRRRYFYCPVGACVPNKSYIYLGRVRSETLVESGKL